MACVSKSEMHSYKNIVYVSKRRKNWVYVSRSKIKQHTTPPIS